ncbi:uncharacterized protein DUF397 [Saccharopolyspora erythraea NRRL 2338]|uniref:Uncharacterized protein n=2 Tax=Saccharopolyspora erythraea TaxID=1836 RepID=A4F647_SACEN|nr:DUF397 domain-containing protein [Saccharopolyspora erythraea]EQD88020.1 regulator [Saccharopolyspora erythraea D]PFG93320.1 uncharacterized protein DUF397 [Saccharopolyspora erythraea NRRL 2338]QRK90162.1 DUF397 domain-containing protein [Saccharopolyspora erythraea]CAL99521.1 hypothetical protein SACE_0169 [Saccharopolyspora erythraea NRRL 2338]
MSLTWRKSSRSGSGPSNCVELAIEDLRTHIRDTKDRDGGTLRVSRRAWASFLGEVKSGGLDLRR